MVIEHHETRLPRREELHGPVLTLHSIDDEGAVLFTIGNQVFFSDISKSNRSDYSSSYPICRIENGDTIIALTSSSVRAEGHRAGDGEESPAMLILSAADTVFWYALPNTQYGVLNRSVLKENTTLLPPIAKTICSLNGDRIIRLRYVKEQDAFLIMSASAVVYWMTMNNHAVASTSSTIPLSSHLADEVRSLPGCSPSFHLTRIPGPSTLGVTLAVDACVVDANPLGSERHPLLHVFSGTYAGSVCEWVKPLGRDPALTSLNEKNGSEMTGSKPHVCSVVPAHGSSCAIFSVQCLTTTISKGRKENSLIPRDATGEVVFTVATCSDDRTAAVFRRTTSLDALSSIYSTSASAFLPDGFSGRTETEGISTWECVWRGGGPDFSHSRVFDVSIFHLDPAHLTSIMKKSVILVGVASEDGGTQLWRIDSNDDEEKHMMVVGSSSHSYPRNATLLWHHTSQHSGHGATRIHIGLQRNSTIPSLVNQDSHFPFIVSAGFDGTVLARSVDPSSLVAPIPCISSKSGNPVAQLYPRLQVVSHGMSTHNNLRDRVRCVVVTDDLHVLVCTEQLFWVTHALGRAVQATALCVPLHTQSQEVEEASGEEQHQLAHGCQPSRITTAVSFLCEEGQRPNDPQWLKCYCAVLGTVGGELLVVPYQVRYPESTVNSFAMNDGGKINSDNNLIIESEGPVFRSGAISAHRKCLMIEKVDFHGASTGRCPMCVVTCHIDQCIVLSQVFRNEKKTERCTYAVEKLAVFHGGPGVHITALKAASANGSYPLFDVVVAGGDRTGTLKLWSATIKSHLEAPKTANHQESGCLVMNMPSISAQVFSKGSGISTIYPLLNDMTSAAPICSMFSFMLTNHDGSYCLWSMRNHSSLGQEHSVDSSCGRTSFEDTVYCPHRLYAIDNCASVLFASTEVLVSVCGTTASVHTAVPGRLWTKVHEVRAVRAPRLLHANAQHKTKKVCLAHCSDGESVEIVTASFDTGARYPPEEDSWKWSGTVALSSRAPLSDSSMVVLYGAHMPGKDFNCCCYLTPSSLTSESCWTDLTNCVLCGNEDSSLVVYTTGASCSYPSNNSLVPSLTTVSHNNSLRGPHHSNILAICALDKAVVVSVGGFSTLVLWAYEKTVYCSSVGQWVVRGLYTSASSRLLHHHSGGSDAMEMGNGERVPRFLGVCQLSADSVAVASSDATIKYFSFVPEISCVARTKVVLEEEIELDPDEPRPVFCLATLPILHMKEDIRSQVNLTVSGDAGGRVFVVERQQRRPGRGCAVLAGQRIEDCAINAISLAHPREVEEGKEANRKTVPPTSWEVATISDAGTVHLLSITLTWGCRSSEGESSTYCGVSCLVVSLSRFSIGITAGRGIAWSSLQDDIIAACEERIVRLHRVSEGERKAQQGMEILQSVKARRSNIRSISGICAKAAMASVRNEVCMSPQSVYEVVVVGQGMEVLYL